MTDHMDVPIVATGDWIDAAWINQYIGDNVRAWRQAYTAAGMIAYAQDANTLAGLAKPAGLGLLQNNAAGALAWLTGGSALQVLRKNAANDGFEFGGGGVKLYYHNSAVGHNSGSASWRDMPNSSKVVTVDVPSSVLCIGFITKSTTDTPNYYGFFNGKFNIDGTDADWGEIATTYGNGQHGVPLIGSKAGVAAGSRTIKLREYCGAGSYHVAQLAYTVVVIPEG